MGSVVPKLPRGVAVPGCVPGVTILVYRYVMTGVWDTLAVCNCILAGLVAVTSGCSVVEPWAGIIIGVGERSHRAGHEWAPLS